MYAQGYSLTEFLLQRKGRQHFLKFLNDAHHRGWDRAIATFYGSQGIEKLEQKWSSWVLAGSPRLDLPKGQLLASTGGTTRSSIPKPSPAGRSGSVVRSQGPEADTPPRPASRDIASATRRNSPQAPAQSGPAALLSRVGQFTRNLTAPDPRARAARTEPTVFQVAASSAPELSRPVPTPRSSPSQKPNSASRQTPPSDQTNQPLQPLVLTKIDDNRSNRSKLAPTPLPGKIQSRLSGNDSARMNNSPEQPSGRYRETRLRTTSSPAQLRSGLPQTTADRFLNWGQFPTRIR